MVLTVPQKQVLKTTTYSWAPEAAKDMPLTEKDIDYILKCWAALCTGRENNLCGPSPAFNTISVLKVSIECVKIYYGVTESS